MLFSSMLFLWCFLPATLAIYYLLNCIRFKDEALKQRIKNMVLLFVSVIFYAGGGLVYLSLIAFVIVFNWAMGLVMCHREGRAGAVLVVSLVVDLGLLFVFKYLNLFIGNTGVHIVLPIGISFYIFQAISYIVDVYRGKTGPQRFLPDFALYISFFPQLIAGPIVKYSDINEQIASRKESVKVFSEGITRFVYGLSKKVLLANTLGNIADSIWANDPGGMGCFVAWLGAICYTFQIYYDFSGYSDMAIGLGKMFGFEYKENFNYPYVSCSVQEFWRRWHISLSSWFKEYLYIPLGGSRCSKARLCFNIFVVFALTGIWHGANLTFLVWGMAYAVLLIAERLFLGELLKKNPIKLINRIYTAIPVILLWVLFRSDNIGVALGFIKEMFSRGSGEYSVFSYLSMQSIAALVFSLLLMFPVYPAIRKWMEKHSKALIPAAEIVTQTVLLLASIMYLIGETYNPFIYFQF